MTKPTVLLAGLTALCAACSETGQARAVETGADRPQRIVSLDYCADQYVLKLADSDQILAVSPDAGASFSYMRAAAQGVPTVRPRAEDVLALRPDLVVRSYGGGPNAAGFFERAGVPVLQVGRVTALRGDGAGAVRGVLTDVAAGLGQDERGSALAEAYAARLAAIPERSGDETALYMTPAGATTGPGSLVHEMLVAVGLANFETTPGWRSIPLERLAYDSPGLVAAAAFGDFESHPHKWSAANHPLARAQLKGQGTVALDGAWTACGAWFLVDAVEALNRGARE